MHTTSDNIIIGGVSARRHARDKRLIDLDCIDR
jgi:hypothetical protein